MWIEAICTVLTFNFQSFADVYLALIMIRNYIRQWLSINKHVFFSSQTALTDLEFNILNPKIWDFKTTLLTFYAFQLLLALENKWLTPWINQFTFCESSSAAAQSLECSATDSSEVWVGVSSDIPHTDLLDSLLCSPVKSPLSVEHPGSFTEFFSALSVFFWEAPSRGRWDL